MEPAQADATFPRFVQVILPAPAADVLQRACRMATEALLEAEQALIEPHRGDVNDVGKIELPDEAKLQIHESARLIEQLDQLAEFFDDIAANPELYPAKGKMAASIKARQRAWRAAQPKKPARKKGQSRRAYEARMARWSRARQEDVETYNAATQQLILADLPVEPEFLRAILNDGMTADDIKQALQASADEQAAQQEKYEAVMAALAEQDEAPDTPGIILP